MPKNRSCSFLAMGPRDPLPMGILSTLLACGGSVPDPPRPNVLFIVIDTLRADRLGCYGAERDTSPAIDALAADAVRFERAYATAPWTQPSVASMLTGLYPSRHGLQRPGPLPADVVPLAERLRAHGYATAAVVSHTLIGHRVDFHRGYERFDERRDR